MEINQIIVVKETREGGGRLKILIFTSVSNNVVPFRLLEAGAQGYLIKDAIIDELAHAIKAINTGQQILSPKVVSRVVLAKINSSVNLFGSLTNREMIVMMMVLHGYTSKDIAKKLYVHDNSVHNYRSPIFRKLKVRNDIELALRYGIISVNDNYQ